MTIDPTHALLTAGYAAVIQQFESNILVPRVMGPSVGISPLTVLIGILIGSALYGLPGTFIAVPITAAAQVLLAHYTRHEPLADRTAPAAAAEERSGKGRLLRIGGRGRDVEV